MSKLFKSLMRDTVGDQVTWTEEWEKASRAKAELFAIIDAMPSVHDILRNMLEAELKRLGKSVDIDKVYINTDPAFEPSDNRPSGSLWQVTLYCVDNNVTPGYIMGGDGVFVLPDTLDDQFKVSGLTIFVVEDLIAAVTAGLEKRCEPRSGSFGRQRLNPYALKRYR